MRTSPFFSRLLTIGAGLVLLLLALMVVLVFIKSWPFLNDLGVVRLWGDIGWFPEEQQFNIVPMIVGSLFIMIGSVVLATPLGVMLALFLRYYAPAPIALVYYGLVELLAGIPSVVYGLWGLIVLVPLIAQWVAPGASVLAACIILALMILPLIVLVADDAFKQTPPQWIAAADALALTQWGRLSRIILPHAMPSIGSGVILQAGRALGETMAVLMVCGNIVQIPHSIFEPARTLTANIALEMAYATDHHSSALFVSGLVLFLLAMILVLFAKRLKPSPI